MNQRCFFAWLSAKDVWHLLMRGCVDALDRRVAAMIAGYVMEGGSTRVLAKSIGRSDFVRG